MKFVIKRVFDFFGSLMGLLILSPLFLIVSILIKINSKGSVFFKQERYGKNEKIFELIKFRSMKINSEKLPYTIKELRQFESSGKDPRLDSLGKFLRKHGLDEIPQLINILKGDMSFVGPRPYFRARVEQDSRLKQRLKIKPGLTSLTVIRGGVMLKEDELLRLDLEYIINNNFVLDIWIILRTIVKVIHGK